MLHIVTTSTSVPEPENPFNFPLDIFQKHAVDAISRDENVLVTAKTGSGKTLVGEYQILHSLKKGKRVFYTTPIKSLSNQKFFDLNKIHPKRVGIMTGDFKFRPDADIVIMTTEILRNLLYKRGTATEKIGITADLSLDNVDAVVFDEVHYINDPDRGKVWEETFVMLPPEINMVLLSATLTKPEKFAEWLGNLKQKPIHLISTEYRVVPLVHTLPNGKVLMDEKEVFNSKVYIDWAREFVLAEKAAATHRTAVKNREEGQVVAKTTRSHDFIHRMNSFIDENKESLPALFFVLSRKMCVAYAKKVEANLITSSDVASVRHIVNFHLHRHPDVMTSTQYFDLMALLEKGVAFHHSGLLPILKEIVEILFSRGFIKVLFATETFAVGLNMPTKTVIFTSFRKVSDNGSFRMLRPDEYTQMAGRAGRRGKDVKGTVVYLPVNQPEPLSEMREMMTGQKAEITSRMSFHYDYVLQPASLDKTFWMIEQNEEIERLRTDIAEAEKSFTVVSDFERAEYAKLEAIEAMPVGKARQSAQNQWFNTHAGPKWKKIEALLSAEILTLYKIEAMKASIVEYSKTPPEIIMRTETLNRLGFIGTQMGVLASEIREGHPLLMAYAFHHRLFHGLTAIETVVALSAFIESKEDDERVPHAHIEALENIATQMRNEEIIHSNDSYWKLNRSWVDIVRRWMTGESSKNLCADYDVDDGTFVRNILKLDKLVEEWRSLATIAQDVEIIELMKDVLIVREVAIPDSLYLHIN